MEHQLTLYTPPVCTFKKRIQGERHPGVQFLVNCCSFAKFRNGYIDFCAVRHKSIIFAYSRAGFSSCHMVIFLTFLETLE